MVWTAVGGGWWVGSVGRLAWLVLVGLEADSRKQQQRSSDRIIFFFTETAREEDMEARVTDDWDSMVVKKRKRGHFFDCFQNLGLSMYRPTLVLVGCGRHHHHATD